MNDKLREAFEAWCNIQQNINDGNRTYEHEFMEHEYRAYQAGYTRALAELDSPEMVGVAVKRWRKEAKQALAGEEG